MAIQDLNGPKGNLEGDFLPGDVVMEQGGTALN